MHIFEGYTIVANMLARHAVNPGSSLGQGLREIHSDLDDHKNGSPVSLGPIPVARKRNLQTLIIGHQALVITTDCIFQLLSTWLSQYEWLIRTFKRPTLTAGGCVKKHRNESIYILYSLAKAQWEIMINDTNSPLGHPIHSYSPEPKLKGFSFQNSFLKKEKAQFISY